MKIISSLSTSIRKEIICIYCEEQPKYLTTSSPEKEMISSFDSQTLFLKRLGNKISSWYPHHFLNVVILIIFYFSDKIVFSSYLKLYSIERFSLFHIHTDTKHFSLKVDSALIQYILTTVSPPSTPPNFPHLSSLLYPLLLHFPSKKFCFFDNNLQEITTQHD